MARKKKVVKKETRGRPSKVKQLEAELKSTIKYKNEIVDKKEKECGKLREENFELREALNHNVSVKERLKKEIDKLELNLEDGRKVHYMVIDERDNLKEEVENKRKMLSSMRDDTYNYETKANELKFYLQMTWLGIVIWVIIWFILKISN